MDDEMTNEPDIMDEFPRKISPNIGFNDPPVLSFDIQGPPPVYPAGGSFGKGSIDLGGLEVYGTLYFLKIWDTLGGNPKDGATFYEPYAFPPDFKLLGHYCRPNDVPFPAAVLVAKDTTGDPNHGALKRPIDYTLMWTSKGVNFGQYDDGYIWLPIPPNGYKAVGHIVTTTPEKPSLDKIMCVRLDFTDLVEVDKWIWGVKMGRRSIDVSTTKPVTRGLSVPIGTFLARAKGSETHNLACLKMVQKDPYLAMPNSLQISRMINLYSPWVYLHPDEEFFPSTVLWFFENGAELHEKNIIPQPVINNGENLPTNGTQDDAFLDLPPNQPQKDKVKKGFLNDAIAYIHVKPELGGTFTDLAIWLYYPFNGGGKLQLGPLAINLGKIGEHVSDWEHITLRIDNYHGILKEIYLSQHAAGKWLTAPEFEFINGTRPVVYSSLHGHAHYATPNYHLHGRSYIDPMDIEEFNELLEMDLESPITGGEKFLGFGVRDDTAKSNYVMDIASSYNVVYVDYKKFDSLMVPWLNYTGRWGPKITYGFTKEVTKIANKLPAKMRNVAMRMLHKLPPELLGEEGPEGPKMKDSWTGDEKVKL
ncbi:uncharacterized protein LOC112520072 [Cynara cardunculus var. scolymus]|uniref:uncharacterized protein LOC112520072 n=1 Tax=Cynara cardunculus var. scolymus TaxID=59895 RepID=UPI000D62954D|nr:uncharacterized protein LOC112520072 [Cynara cardunculus var. scolymus]